MMMSSRTATLLVSVALFAAATRLTSAFSVTNPTKTSVDRAATNLYSETPSTDRRSFLTKASTAAVAAAIIASPQSACAAGDSKEALVKDLEDSLAKLKGVPEMIRAEEWDKVRTVLKTPPVNQLWNLGESQNTIVKLAKATGEFELLEVKDDLAISLQMTDQYVYDNNFIYYQPGNGKTKVKEPMEMAGKAMVALQEAIDAVR